MKKIYLLCYATSLLLMTGCFDWDALTKGSTTIFADSVNPKMGSSTSLQENDQPAICVSGKGLFNGSSVAVDGRNATVILQSPDDGSKLCFRLPMSKGKAGPVDIVVKNAAGNSSSTIKGFSYYLGTPKIMPQPAGTLSESPLFLVKAKLASADFTDLVFASATTQPLEVWLGMDTKTPQIKMSQVGLNANAKVAAMVRGDFDGSTMLDEIALVTKEPDPSTNSNLFVLKWNLLSSTANEFTNTTAGSSQLLTNIVPNQLLAANLDGAGQDELLIGSATEVTLWNRANTNGNFTKVALGAPLQASPLFLLSQDVDVDGKLDILTGDLSNQFMFYKNTSQATFQFSMPQPAVTLGSFSFSTMSSSVQLVAFEKDKAPYLVASGTSAGTPGIQIWAPSTTGIPFGTGTFIPLANAPRALLMMDINVDGKPDIVSLSGVGKTEITLLIQDPLQTTVVWKAPLILPDSLPCTTNQNLVTMLDKNKDNLPDLVIACSDNKNVNVLLNVSE